MHTLATTVGLIVDLFCFCVVSHSYRAKYYVLRNNVVEKVCVHGVWVMDCRIGGWGF